MKSGMKSIIWYTKLTILSCILSVGDWKQLTNRTSTSLPTSTQKMSISQLLFFLNIFVTWALFFFQANNIYHLFFQYKWKKLAKKHEQLIQKGFEMFWRRNANLNSIFNHIARKPCLSWFYFTTISMVTIWPNVIIPCSWTHIYHLMLSRVPTPHPPPPTPASHWPLNLWLWLTYPWSSGYQPFEIWHQTLCIVGVLDRAFFWPLFGISSLTTHWIYCFFLIHLFWSILSFFFSLNFNSSLHLSLDLLQSLLTHLVNMWTFFFLSLFHYHCLTSSYIYLCSNIPFNSYL